MTTSETTKSQKLRKVDGEVGTYESEDFKVIGYGRKGSIKTGADPQRVRWDRWVVVNKETGRWVFTDSTLRECRRYVNTH